MNSLQKKHPKQLGKNWKTTLNILFVVIVIFVIGYKVINHVELKTTSALFIGMPTLIGLLIVNLTQTRSSYGMTVKASLIILCLIAPILGEGSICIIMMAPLFLAMNLLIVFIYKKINKCLCTLIAFLPFFVGLVEKDSLKKEQALLQVTTETIVGGNVEKWHYAIERPIHLSKDIPFFLKLGFPLPSKIVNNGSQLSIFFDKGGKWAVEKIWDKNVFKYSLVKDTSKISSWINIRDSIIEISVIDNNKVLIRQTTSYYSKVFPRWYFHPFQEIAIKQVHRLAISSWNKS